MKTRILSGGLAALALCCSSASALDPTTLYGFESALGSTTTPESVSDGTNFATLGSGGSIASNSRRLGSASLRLRADKAGTTAGTNDSALTSNTYNWTSSDIRTVAFWMRAKPVQSHAFPTMISMGSGTGTGARFDIRLDLGTGADGNLRLEIQGGYVATTAADFTTAGLSFTTLRDDKWHHVAVVVPNLATTVRNTVFYIDGVPVPHSNQGSDAAINTATSNLRIGDSYWDATRNFTGYLDDLRIYDIGLTAQETLDLYNSGVTNASAIAAFDADPEIIGPGMTSSLSWQTIGATELSIDHGIGIVTGQTSVTTTPVDPGTTTYTLTVTTPTATETASLPVTTLGALQATAPKLSGTGFSFTAINLVPGKTYQAEYQNTSLESTWTSLGATFTGPLSTTRTVTDATASAASNPKAFYRVRQLP
ncbi:LamG domain-containing protein [Luteolibacter sp. LG18]|uniref:LamG domain-containing protein n=1 Tax=Luteolibacter sp. LG18 TaxID=2819286 RepID=UPI002B2C3904|nr:hypothetical protein llg_32580 [Luteolibacter sp. LG18]